MPNDDSLDDLDTDDRSMAERAEDNRAIERLFAALPELYPFAVEYWGDWGDPVTDAGSFIIYSGVFGQHLNSLVGSDTAELEEDRDRAFIFLEHLSRDGLEALDRSEDRLLYSLAQEVLGDISLANLPRAYTLMGPSTRVLLAEKAAWNDYARVQARRYPGRWLVDNIEAFHQAYQQATGEASADRPKDSDRRQH
jgi:hypothetical protein